MRATGIIRRIDDLGRVVIPKEIRRSMKIKEGDPLEIFTEGNALCFRRYNPIDEEKWEIAKNILRHLLVEGFEIADRDKETKFNSCGARPDKTTTPIKSEGDIIGYITTEQGVYTDEELAAAVKIAREVLES